MSSCFGFLAKWPAWQERQGVWLSLSPPSPGSAFSRDAWWWRCSRMPSHVQLLQPPGHPQAPMFMEFPMQEYWSGLPFPSLGHLPNLGVELRSPALQADTLLTEPPGKLRLALFPMLQCSWAIVTGGAVQWAKPGAGFFYLGNLLGRLPWHILNFCSLAWGKKKKKQLIHPPPNPISKMGLVSSFWSKKKKKKASLVKAQNNG